MILTDSMLDAAFRFRESEPWAELTDSDIFAVRTTTGETAYCTIMGNGGEHFALGIYIGNEGFSTYLRSLNLDGNSIIRNMQQSVTFDCINCDFMQAKDIDPNVKKAIRKYAESHGETIPRKHGWIDFTRFTPYMGQWCITDSNDAQIAEEALRAAVFFVGEFRRNGLEETGLDPDGNYPDNKGGKKIPLIVHDAGTYSIQTTTTPAFCKERYMVPIFSNDALAHRLREIEPTEGVECRLEHVPMPIQAEHSERPVFPALLMIVNQSDGNLLAPLTTFDYHDNPQAVLTQIADHFCRLGIRPQQIKVSDERTLALLRDLCKTCGMKLKKEKSLPDLDDVCDSMLRQMIFGTMF